MAAVLQALCLYGVLETAIWVGSELRICCPFHEDHTPSCGLRIDRGFFHCFACGEGGNFTRLIEGIEARRGKVIDPFQALLIAEGQLLPDQAPQKYNDIRLDMDKLDHYFSRKKQSQNKQEARRDSYLFYKSLPHIDWEQNPDHYLLQERGYDTQTLQENYVKLNPVSENPIIIPLLENNKFKGYVARRADSNKDRKYKNSRGLDRNNILAGLLPDKPAPLLVVEGPLDRLTAYQLGFRYSVSLLGWKVSEYQIKKLLQHASCLIWATDNDEAGREGYAYAKHILEPHIHTTPLFRFPFPAGFKDIGDFIHCPLVFTKIIEPWVLGIFGTARSLP